jgi:dethiobiotin synthetase
MAAHREKREINVREVSDYCQNFCAIHEGYILIEGVGGVMVPLNDRETVLDLMLALKIPTLLVTGSYLGTISHTLTAYKALTNNGITVKAIIISESLESPVPLEELAETMLRFAAVPICIAPRINEHMPRPWEHMPDLTHLLEV